MKICVLLATCFCLLSITHAFSQSIASPNLVVQTYGGALQGKAQSTPGGTARAFLGIPYALPPTGELRWKPPQIGGIWKGVRDVTSFGPRCMQLPLYDDMYFRDPGTSEDCLTLNVWTPANTKSGDKLPVMFWIYGGGFITGSTSEWRQGWGSPRDQGCCRGELQLPDEHLRVLYPSRARS